MMGTVCQTAFNFNFCLFSIIPQISSTINPILYNVMSHRYRVAFRETLCGRRRGFGAGFARDQSSFRETTIDVNMAGGGGSAGFGGYENSRLVSDISWECLRLETKSKRLKIFKLMRYK